MTKPNESARRITNTKNRDKHYKDRIFQNGGVNDVVPIVVNQKTARSTPFITNKAKDIYQKNVEDRNVTDTRKPSSSATREQFNPNKPPNIGKQKDYGPAGTPVVTPTTYPMASTMQPTLELKLFEPATKQPQPMGMYNPYNQYIQPGPPLNLFGSTKDDKAKAKEFSANSFQHLFAPTSATSCGPNVKIPMQQVYNINLPGPTGGHVEMNKIYEDILPGKGNKLTSTTLGERLQTYDYIRQIIIKINEGEEISIDTQDQNNLMSYIKLIELNPGYYSVLHSNPYKGLPYGLLVYGCCFPIRYDRITQSTICAKNSIGLNIRLYALTCAEHYSYKFRQTIYIFYDVWRELAYYQYIRENILKRKQSPNFPLMYSYFLSPNKKIDFFKLKKSCLTQKDLLSLEYKNFEKCHALSSSESFGKLIRPMGSIANIPERIVEKLPDEVDPTLQAYSGTTLIIITEASHHNLYQWASRIYEQDGIVNKMISNGYHNESVWINIIFQIIAALHVMQVHGIYIRNMTIGDNVYIKDLQNYGKPMGYWKYIINGIPYYIPNYGYIVFLDSNFKDIHPTDMVTRAQKREYKIYTSNIFGKKYSMKSIRRKVFENYQNIISTNSFTKEHTQNNVFRPPESVMKIIEAMMEDAETDLGNILAKYFRQLMNNRIGTLLRKDSEVPNIREITGNLKNGEMTIEVIEENLYKWCMVSKIKADGIIEIITRDNPKSNDFITKDVRIETLKQYSPSEKIEQNTNPEVNFSEEELLETYIVSSIDEDC